MCILKRQFTSHVKMAYDDIVVDIPLVPLSIDQTADLEVMTYEHTKYMVNLVVCNELLLDYTKNDNWDSYKVNVYDSSREDEDEDDEDEDDDEKSD